MHLEDFEASLEQRLDLGVLDIRNKAVLHQIIDRLVIAEFVGCIATVKGGAAQLAHLVDQLLCALIQGFAQEIVLGLGLEFRQQRQCLIVHRRMVLDHGAGEGVDLGVGRDRQRQMRESVDARDLVSHDMLSKAEAVVGRLGKVDYLRIDGKLIDGDFVAFELTSGAHLGRGSQLTRSIEGAGISYEVMLELICKISMFSGEYLHSNIAKIGDEIFEIE
jgi:hypothetical protein